MEASKYSYLGSGIVRYVQVTLITLSIFLGSIVFLFRGSLHSYLIFAFALIAVNLIVLCFSDIKWNTEQFVVEKLFAKKVIPSHTFVEVNRLMLFNVLIVKFNAKRYYCIGDIGTILKSGDELTNEIRKRLNST